jgi:hypothetical protein
MNQISSCELVFYYKSFMEQVTGLSLMPYPDVFEPNSPEGRFFRALVLWRDVRREGAVRGSRV